MYLLPEVRATQSAGRNINTTTTETSLFNTLHGTGLAVPGGYVDKPGTSFRLVCIGRISTRTAPVGNLTWRLKGFGKTLAFVHTGGPEASLSDDLLEVTGYLNNFVAGSAGVLYMSLNVKWSSSDRSLNGEHVYSEESSTDFDSDSSLDMTVQWATSHANNNVGFSYSTIEELNS